ncbi:unnamed protein product [Anisakis simplex]|uniref:lysozyme n=1 Tax=Anisakis simplex TaxID=6269 RepID=A0A0M3KFC5_ANISI|nr:unnamed protein product [Anisakis simplex]
MKLVQMIEKISVEFDDDCMRAMCETDSGCVPKGCSRDIYGRLGCGYFRLNIYQYKQCYQPGRLDDQDEDEAWIACSEDYQCSQQCLRVCIFIEPGFIETNQTDLQ